VTKTTLRVPGCPRPRSGVDSGGRAKGRRGLPLEPRACTPPTTRGARSTRELRRWSSPTTAGRQLDGGIRRGGDVVKALCLGARAALIGRAYAYGLGAGGKAGVTKAIAILRADLERTLKLLGCPSVEALDSTYVQLPAHWRA
jgi:hypothetical protein